MKKYVLWLCIFFCGKAFAHPMPSSVVELSVLQNIIRGEAKIPLLELANAVGDQKVTNLTVPFFKNYFLAHISAVSAGKQWQTQIETIGITTDQDPFVGTYKEVIVQFTLMPPDAKYLRTFTFNYDVVMHQVVTHSALIYVKEDWNNGIHEATAAQQVGIIKMDVPTEKIYPLQVNLEEGSWWKGFQSMFTLGMQHIKEGTDHLLFLIVLLLPAMLVVNGKRWGGFGGIRYSIARLVKIVTAFTIGHSITLSVAALGWVKLPSQPVEVLIAFSILVSAVHAIRPAFPGKEVFIALGFGLIHGLAFATVLSNLALPPGKLALSVLGFNLGIEIMQLFVIAITVPWLIVLSKRKAYNYIRITGATFAATAAIAWMVQRAVGEANFLSTLVEGIAGNAR